jgi:hypothetical protein
LLLQKLAAYLGFPLICMLPLLVLALTGDWILGGSGGGASL